MSEKDYNYVNCSLCNSSESHALYKFNYKKFGLKEPFILVRCAHCGQVYNNPRLKTGDLKQSYNKEYGVIKQGKLEKRLWLPALEDYVNKIRPLEGKISGRNLLDIGCGLGFLMKICQDNGWQVQGVDISDIAVEYARDTLGLSVELKRIEDVDFGGRKFNLILALGLLEHLEQPVEFIKRCYNLLEENGVLLIEAPNFGSIFRKITRRFWVGFTPYRIQHFSKDTIARMVSATDFKILDIYTTNNDIFIKRNLWRWFSHPEFVKAVFDKTWQLKRKIFSSNICSDIVKQDASYSSLEKTMRLNKLIEKRDNFIANKFLGDQLTVFLIKS